MESHAIDAVGPGGEQLAFDVAISPHGDRDKVLVVSTGLHGIEGFFGSAVQLALLEQWVKTGPPSVRCVFVHGLNPFGFAWRRRFDENNVDLNRNFLLAAERFEGVPLGYAQINRFLNPTRRPSRWEPFFLKAAWLIAKYGMPALRQAVAGGQYRFPQGLFFGGTGPSQTQGLLAEHLPNWLAGSRSVVHLDFHTGLGARHACKLLIDSPLTEPQRGWFVDTFGSDMLGPFDAAGIAYDARGGLGRWCVSKGLARDYLFACAEFGTYGPVRVLAGLRAENQAHHWGDPDSAATRRTKDRLQEVFCPTSPTWRARAVATSIRLIEQAERGLLRLPLPSTATSASGILREATHDPGARP